MSMLLLWYVLARNIDSFSQFRLINLEHIVAHEESWDLTNFHTLLTHQIAANRQILRRVWYSGIQEIFLVVKYRKRIN